MKFLILGLVTLLLFSCDSNSKLTVEEGKSNLLSPFGLCNEEFSNLEGALDLCKKNESFQSNLIKYSCRVFDDRKLKSKIDVENMDLCINKIDNMTCDNLSVITKISQIENCYLYDKAGNYKTKKEACVDNYHDFCKDLDHSCVENLTTICKEAKFIDNSAGNEPNISQFNKQILENYCDLSDGDEKLIASDLKCALAELNSCQDFEAISYDIDQYYTSCPEG